MQPTMMPHSTREKWLLAVLPALAVLFVGWLGFLRPANTQLETMSERVAKLGPLEARQAQVKQAKAEVIALQKTVAARRSERGAELGGFDRNRAMQQVSLLCVEHGLSLNATTLDTSVKLPQVLQDAGAVVPRTDANTPPQVWRIELSGAYSGMVGLLEGLKQTKPLIVPLTVSMETGKNERLPAKWVLTVWL